MILAVLQARTSSSRLPNKVLSPILGRPMLERQIERVRRSRLIDRLIIATSDEKSDDPLADLCRQLKVDCFRGSLEDVLDRFYRAAEPHKAEHIVRLTGDCPLADPQVIDDVITFYLDGGYDYASNALRPTMPDGLDIEIFRFSALEKAWREARLPSQREHVTPFIHSQPQIFKLGSYTTEPDRSHLRWTVDEPADLAFVAEIYKRLYPRRPDFSTADILDLLDREPDLQKINSGFERNEGMKKSLAEDEKFKTVEEVDA